MQFAGMATDVPNWVQFQADIVGFRSEIDEQANEYIEHETQT